jgi:hypothetical protein
MSVDNRFPLEVAEESSAGSFISRIHAIRGTNGVSIFVPRATNSLQGLGEYSVLPWITVDYRNFVDTV